MPLGISSLQLFHTRYLCRSSIQETRVADLELQQEVAIVVACSGTVELKAGVH